jgi:hypothetical protein
METNNADKIAADSASADWRKTNDNKRTTELRIDSFLLNCFGLRDEAMRRKISMREKRHEALQAGTSEALQILKNQQQ